MGTTTGIIAALLVAVALAADRPGSSCRGRGTKGCGSSSYTVACWSGKWYYHSACRSGTTCHRGTCKRGGGGGSTGGGGRGGGGTRPRPAPRPQPGGGNKGGGGGGDISGGYLTEAEFRKAVKAVKSSYPTPSHDKYKQAVGKAKSNGNITSKREFLMFLTHVLHESDGFKAKREYRCATSQCPGEYAHSQDCPGQHYFGRGYLQLSWSYNYRPASKAIFKDEMKLCKDPDLVARDEDVAWDTAFWFWKARVHKNSKVQQGMFGATTRVINAGWECDGSRKDIGRERFANYKKIIAAVAPTVRAIEGGCYN